MSLKTFLNAVNLPALRQYTTSKAGLIVLPIVVAVGLLISPLFARPALTAQRQKVHLSERRDRVKLERLQREMGVLTDAVSSLAAVVGDLTKAKRTKVPVSKP